MQRKSPQDKFRKYHSFPEGAWQHLRNALQTSPIQREDMFVGRCTSLCVEDYAYAKLAQCTFFLLHARHVITRSRYIGENSTRFVYGIYPG